jgi:hypothetical protein
MVDPFSSLKRRMSLIGWPRPASYSREALIGLDLSLIALIGIVKRRRKILTCT